MLLQLKYGKGFASAKIRMNSNMIQLEPNHIASLQKPPALIAKALEKPVAAYPLKTSFRRSKNLLLVVSNRHWPDTTKLLLAELLNALNQVAVPDAEIGVLVANGADGPLPRKAVAELLGDDLPKRISVYQHDFRDTQALEYIGETRKGTQVFVNKHLLDADEIILCDSVSHHIFAGYSGGPALIVPGCAGQETISRLCQLALAPDRKKIDPLCTDGSLAQNPVYHEIREACRNISPRFGVYAVTNNKGELISAYAGNPYQAHAAACRALDQLNVLPIAKKASLTIVGAGGAPKDETFLQSITALSRGCAITEEGGIVILVAACANGVGAAAIERFDQKKAVPSHPSGTAELTPADLMIMASRESARSHKIFVVSQLEPALVRQMGFQPFASLQNALETAEAQQSKAQLTYVIADGTVVVPQNQASERGLSAAHTY